MSWRDESGQAAVEWTGLVLLATLAFAAFLAVGPRIDGRSFGGFLTHAIVCAVRGGCDDGDAGLAAVYGGPDAALVREYAPNIVYEPGTYTLPVDFRECRSHTCADAPDDKMLDVHSSLRGGVRATAFTHVVHSGGDTFLQYWFYYPDSTTTVANAAGLWHDVIDRAQRDPHSSYPGFHEDDWEGYQVKIDAMGTAAVRATSHHGYQGCKQLRCHNQWTPWTGWTRVSRGSHAGHIPLRDHGGGIHFDGLSIALRPHDDEPIYPGVDLDERTTTAAGLRLVPVEPLAGGNWTWDGITPPWKKEVYTDPRSDSTS